MEFKGTKGKWFSSSLEVISMPTQTKIGKISGNNFDEARFNALLISKAPEMLEMLHKCQEYFLLKTDKYSDERADAIGQLIEDATEIKNK
jgi:hypothetical protein